MNTLSYHLRSAYITSQNRNPLPSHDSCSPLLRHSCTLRGPEKLADYIFNSSWYRQPDNGYTRGLFILPSRSDALDFFAVSLSVSRLTKQFHRPYVFVLSIAHLYGLDLDLAFHSYLYLECTPSPRASLSPSSSVP